jgi:hypothetical protein
MGMSPIKTSCSFISPVSLFTNLESTFRGAVYDISLILHSSGVAISSSKLASINSRDIFPVKSSMGEISLRASISPSSRNH